MNQSDLAKGPRVATIVPYLKEYPPSPFLAMGWPDTVLACDHARRGFVHTVNAAIKHLDSGCYEWYLIWNSDAQPLFTHPALLAGLSHFPEAACSILAPCKNPNEDSVKVAGTHTGTRVITHWNITDTGPLALTMAGEELPPYMEVFGTAYSPLYCIRRHAFYTLGGLPTIYGAGYFDDAHMWRLARRMGYRTHVLPGLMYSHVGQGTFSQTWEPDDLRALQDKNLWVYLRHWGHLEANENTDLFSWGSPPGGVSTQAAADVFARQVREQTRKQIYAGGSLGTSSRPGEPV